MLLARRLGKSCTIPWLSWFMEISIAAMQYEGKLMPRVFNNLEM